MSDNSIQILIVEDEALIAETIKLMLQDFGYPFSATCYTYEAAIQAINNTYFDLLITDIDLGKGTNKNSGLDVAIFLKQIKNIPFIFLTAHSDVAIVKKAAALLPSAYLVKPINPANVYAAVQLAIENFKTFQAASLNVSETAIQPDYFFVKMGQLMVKIFWVDVYYMEAIKNYVKIKTAQYPSGVLIRSSLQQVMTNMIPDNLKNGFIKINRSETIAKSIIETFGSGVVNTSYGSFSTNLELKVE